MTIRHLKIFICVCECGGITKAAESLHMAQPSVSTTISELEKYYNVSLFDRINQRLVLTPTGKDLLVKAKNALAGFDDFETAANFGGQNPYIRIGSSLTLGKTVLPRYISLIKERLPNLKPSFFIDRTAAIEEKIECGAIDFGIVEGIVRSPYLKITPIGGDRLIAVCSPGDMKKSVCLAELIKYPLLLREIGSASRDLLSKNLAERHLSVKPFAESVSNEALVSLAKDGHGIAVLPEGIVKDAIKQGSLCELTISDAVLMRTHYIVTHKNKRFNSLCQAAFHLLSEQATSCC